jgi:hypothetical protein
MSGRLGAVALAAAALAGGCEEDDPFDRSEAPQPTCRMPFIEYNAGPAVGGFHFEARVTDCNRRPFVTYIYGTCQASSDSGCAPPLEVQTWSYCHRKPRGSSPTDFGVRRGEVTVMIFARDSRLAHRAVAALRKAKPADRSLPLTRKLRGCAAR